MAESDSEPGGDPQPGEAGAPAEGRSEKRTRPGRPQPRPAEGARSRRRKRRARGGAEPRREGSPRRGAGPAGGRPSGRRPRGPQGEGGGGGADGDRRAKSDDRGRERRKRPRLKQRPADFEVVEVCELDDLVGRGQEGGGPYYVHRLTKQKRTTLQAIDLLARRYDIPKVKFGYGGLKDKQSYSEQLISIEGRAIRHRERFLKCTCIGRRQRAISSEDIRANRFRITLRGLSAASLEGLDAQVERVRAFGFPNYFDSQRFGSVRFGQGLMARELVRGRPEQALRLYMATPSERDHSSDKHLKRILRERWGDWEGLVRRVGASPYGKIVEHLVHHPGDFWGAVGRMRRPIRALQLFSYQSLVWNESLRAYLRAVVPGRRRFEVDYVCGRLTFFDDLSAEAAALLKAATVPLVGPELELPPGVVGEAVASALKAEGVDLSSFALPASSGAFFKAEERAAVVVPEDLSVSEPFPDKRNERGLAVELRFSLPRGAYGTLVIKRLFRGLRFGF